MSRTVSIRRAIVGVLEQLECRRMLSGEGEPLDFGDAPDSYRTTLALNGARHFATPNLLLGNIVDPEPDGQPSPDALRDDLTGPVDDEDGVTFLTPITPGAVATAQVVNGAGAGILNAWMDFNINGIFDAGERILNNVPLPAASVNILNFFVPNAAMIGQTYSRFRLAATFDCPAFGPFGFGEVEDYRVRIEDEGDLLDFGDAPESAGAPFLYPTTLGGPSGNPARHQIAPNGPRLGPTIDAEPDGQPHLQALGDDLGSIYGGIDDEDGITVGGVAFENVTLFAGVNVPIEVNNMGAAGLLHAWFDWNQDGTWGPGEQVAANLPVPPGVTILNVLVPAGTPVGATIYSRFRLSTAANLAPGGFAQDGEVEDYANRVGQVQHQLDFGDAPDTAAGPFMYPTMLAGASGDPARHIITAAGPRLGPSIDPEPDGQQTLLANGDDTNNVDDEDGVTVGGVAFETVPLIAGSLMTVQVTNSGPLGRLNAWFDWNENGNWEAVEQVAVNLPCPPGVTNVSFFVPGTLTINSQIYSRFRLSTAAGLSPKGLAPDGEVEDYRNRVLPDTVAPKVIAGTLEYEKRQAITLLFDEPLNPLSVSVGDLNALNLDDGTTPVANAVILSAGNTAATWIFNTPGTFINDGDYSFTLPAGAVSDVAGNAMAAAYNLSGPTIFYFGGDTDRNRIVNLNDFNTMVANFGTNGNIFSQGNFDYDALGSVGLLDFNILAARFGTAIAPAMSGPGPGEATVFGQTRIADSSDDMIELLA